MLACRYTDVLNLNSIKITSITWKNLGAVIFCQKNPSCDMKDLFAW